MPHVLSRTPGRIKWTGGAPGTDNEYVYEQLLGWDKGALAELRAEGVI